MHEACVIETPYLGLLAGAGQLREWGHGLPSLPTFIYETLAKS